MYELMILTLLARRSAHGYLIAKIINDMIGPYARLSNGRLYPLLSRMEETGLIEVNEESVPCQKGERNLRSYRLTEDGSQRLHALMMDTTSNPGEYQRIFMQKAPVLDLLKLSERLYLIDHYINYCQAHVLHLTAEAEDLVVHENDYHWNSPTQLAATLDMMKHMTDQWRLELEWALSLRRKELTRAEASGSQEENQDRNVHQNHL